MTQALVESGADAAILDLNSVSALSVYLSILTINHALLE